MKKRHEKMGEPVTMMTFSKAFKYSEEVEIEETEEEIEALNFAYVNCDKHHLNYEQVAPMVTQVN